MCQGIYRVNAGLFRALVMYKTVQCTSICYYGLYCFVLDLAQKKNKKRRKNGRKVITLSVI